MRARILSLRVRCYAVTKEHCRVQLAAAASVGKRMRSRWLHTIHVASGASRTIRLRVTTTDAVPDPPRRAAGRATSSHASLSDRVGHVNRRTLRVRVRAPR